MLQYVTPETLTSWQIHVVALISQYPHLQYLTSNVFLIAPAKRVEILRLSTPPVHAGVAAACPCGRTRTGTKSALETTSYVYDTPDNCTRTLPIFCPSLSLSWFCRCPRPMATCDDRLSFDPLDK